LLNSKGTSSEPNDQPLGEGSQSRLLTIWDRKN
jgi:hypothetical protein